MLRTTTLSLAIVSTFGAAAADAAPFTMADVAPRDAVMLLSVSDWTSMQESFDRTRLGDMTEEEDVQDFIDRVMEEQSDGPIARLRAADIDLERIGWPMGMAGFATWFGPAEDGLGLSSHWLAVADYGERAEDVDDILFDFMLDMEDRRAIEVEEEEIGDTAVFTIRWLQGEDEQEPEENNGERAERIPGEDDAVSGAMSRWLGLDRATSDYPIRWARVGDHIALASDVEAIERVIDMVEGVELDALAGSDDYIQSFDELQRPVVYAGVFIAPILRYMDDAQAAPPDPLGGMIPGLSTPRLMSALGLSEVRSLTSGLRFDTADAMTELSVFAGAEEKSGLLGLLLPSDGPFDPPSFIDADTTSIDAFNFDFSRVPSLVQKVMQSMPEQARAEAAPMVGAAMAAAAPLFQSLAPQIYQVQHIRRPFSARSQAEYYAIRTRDAATVSALLAQNGQMIGLERRDFGGNEIWEIPAEVGGPGAPAFGIGFGHVFIGPVREVENAMRAAGAADAPRLSEERRFIDATRPLKPSGLAYSYLDMDATIKHFEWVNNHVEEIIRAQIEPMLSDADEEWAERLIEEQVRRAEESVFADFPSAELMLRYIGDVAAEAHSTQRGFRIRTLLFSADR